MAFSPGWCYQPGLKGPGLYISNGSCIFYFSIYTSILAAATAIFDLASVAQPRPTVELVSPPHPVSAAAPKPTLRRQPLPARPRRRAPPDGRRARLPRRTVVVPHRIDLVVSAMRRPRARCSARPRGRPARPARPAIRAPASLLASCSRPYFFYKVSSFF